MKKLLLSGVAALFLATEAAQAEPKWWTDCRHGWITKEFGEIEGDNPPVEIMGTSRAPSRYVGR